ncbi:DUF334 domain-containing protein, partial [Listeria monocytogenes]|nr:DUF334 domain-containing protein [Listeria monocytogenes]
MEELKFELKWYREKTTLNLSKDDRALLQSIKAEQSEKVTEKVEDVLTKAVDEKLNVELIQNRVYDSMQKNEEKLYHTERRLAEELQESKKQSTLFKTGLMGILFAILFIGVVATFMGGLFNVLGFDHMYKGLEYQINHSEGFVAFLWHLGYLIPYLLLATLIWLLFALERK